MTDTPQAAILRATAADVAHAAITTGRMTYPFTYEQHGDSPGADGYAVWTIPAMWVKNGDTWGPAHGDDRVVIGVDEWDIHTVAVWCSDDNGECIDEVHVPRADGAEAIIAAAEKIRDHIVAWRAAKPVEEGGKPAPAADQCVAG